MNTDLAAFATGVLAFAISIADTVCTGKFVRRAQEAKPGAGETSPQDDASLTDDSEMQTLRRKILELNNELLGLRSGPVTSMEQLTQVVTDHLEYRRRQEAVHQFVTRKREIGVLAKDWVKIQTLAFKLSKQDSEKVGEIMQRFSDNWLSLSASTGGESELEGQIESLIAEADKEILTILPESERKRYRPIPRGWSSGLVGDPAPK